MALSLDKTVLSTAFSTVFQNSIEVSGCHTLTGLCKHKLPLHYFMRIKNDMELKIISKKVCPRWGSNSRPSDYETDALPTALPRLTNSFLQNIIHWDLENILVKNHVTHGGTRTPNLRFRRPTPYPLGHAGTIRTFETFGWSQQRTPEHYTFMECVCGGNVVGIFYKHIYQLPG